MTRRINRRKGIRVRPVGLRFVMASGSIAAALGLAALAGWYWWVGAGLRAEHDDLDLASLGAHGVKVGGHWFGTSQTISCWIHARYPCRSLMRQIGSNVSRMGYKPSPAVIWSSGDREWLTYLEDYRGHERRVWAFNSTWVNAARERLLFVVVRYWSTGGPHSDIPTGRDAELSFVVFHFVSLKSVQHERNEVSGHE